MADVGDAPRTGGHLRRWLLLPAGGLLLALILSIVSAHVRLGHPERALDAAAYSLIILASAVMVVSARWPRTAVVLATAVLCGYLTRGYPEGPVWLAGPVSLAVLSLRTDRRTAIAGAAGMVGVLTVTTALAGDFRSPLSLVFLGWSAAAVLLGEALRNRRAYLAGLVERTQILERGREQEIARRMAEERLRIARDLHDGVAHAMATINVQAGAAGHVLDRKPEAAGEALEAIQRASADVLVELGQMLTLLRGNGHAERTPMPGMRDIPSLVDTVAASGLVVTLHLDGARRDLPPAVSTAVYRVVQEALTNVLRHSQARTARVKIDAPTPSQAVTVQVIDPGPARPHPMQGLGVGLRGMEERVTATGGRLHAAATDDGGFAVRAEWSTVP